MAKKPTCMICGEMKPKYHFSKHRNDVVDDGFGFCKDCLKREVNDEDMNSVFDMLRLMNVPFVSSVWENAVEQKESNIFSKYLQLIATQKRYQDFSDSIYEDEIAIPENAPASFEVTDDVIVRWGSKDDEREYIQLEKAYETLIKIKEPATYLETQRYVQNVKLGKALNEALESGSKDISSLRKAYADDLKELGLDTISAQKDDNRSIGMRIAEWETHEPLPEISKEFDDVDGLSQYIRKWFQIPMKRIFGQATEDEISELYEGL